MVHLKLCKAPLCLLIALTGLFGYTMQVPHVSNQAWLCFMSILLLAAGSATLNNLQDHYFDLKLTRTKNRALPSSRVSRKTALIQAIALISLSLTILYLQKESATAIPFYLGVTAILLYNGIYTPLKQRTILAIIPGSVCGMMPPLIGWFWAGGEEVSPQIITAMLIIGVWQLPHFWLLMLQHAQDYQRGNAPSMLKLFSHKQILRLVFLWVLVFAFLTLFLPFFNIVFSGFGKVVLTANALLLCTFFTYGCFFRNSNEAEQNRLLFIHLNIALALVIVTGIADQLV